MRMTIPTQLVLRFLLEEPGEERYGYEIGESAGLPSGTVHPILARLEGAGWLASTVEDVDATAAGRPARRYYRLTPDGVLAPETASPAPTSRANQRSGPGRSRNRHDRGGGQARVVVGVDHRAALRLLPPAGPASAGAPSSPASSGLTRGDQPRHTAGVVTTRARTAGGDHLTPSPVAADIVRRLLRCRLGWHSWVTTSTSDGTSRYLGCRRCPKETELTRPEDFIGGGGFGPGDATRPYARTS